MHVTCWSSRSKITTLNMYLHFIVPPPHTYVFFYCISYLSICQRSHIGDVSSIRRLGSLYKYTSGNFRLSRALDKQLPALLNKCIVCKGKKPAPLRTQQCCPTFLLEPQCYLLTALPAHSRSLCLPPNTSLPSITSQLAGEETWTLSLYHKFYKFPSATGHSSGG